MRKISILLFSVLCLASSGYAFTNRVTISSNYDNALSVVIDGRFYEISNINKEINISNLRPGIRFVKVYLQSKYGRGDRRGSDRNMRLLYNGNVIIKEGYDVDMVINRFGKAFIDEQPINRLNNRDDRDDHEGHDGRNDDDGYYGNQNNHSNMELHPMMSDRMFLQLKQTISRASFDEEKVNLVKAALGDDFLSSSQVKDLLAYYPFEKTKLDVAKYCYRYTSDASNYYAVADAFTFSSSKSELLAFIQQNKSPM
jgi:hypothetical protein